MKLLKTLNLNQTGDTIIEVLMALAVLSLSLGISYATASNGLNRSRSAEEHSEALGLLDDQVEKLRTSITSNIMPPSNFFCMTSTGAYSSTFANQYSASDGQDAAHDYSAYPASCKSGFYNISISSNGSDFGYTNTPATSPETNYTFTIRWNGIGNLGPQQESINYRIGAISETLGNFVLPQSTAAPPEYDTYVIEGSDYSTCAAYAGGQSSSSICFPSASATNGSLYSFSDYIVSYSLASVPAGSYSITITYGNSDNGSWPPPSTGNFMYNIPTTIGSTWSTTLNLPTSGSNITEPVGTVTIPANSTITFNWDNNQWVDANGNGEGVDNNNPSSGSLDPNLQINSVILTHQNY